MTEVRSSSSGGQELFASKDYAVGDVILEETPIIRVAPSTADESAELIRRWNGPSRVASNTKKDSDAVRTSFTGILEPPSTVPAQLRSKFRAMVQAGLCFLQQAENGDVWQRLSKLYYPQVSPEESSAEKSLIDMAKEACQYMKCSMQTADSKDVDWDKVQTVMLIWACNAFDGGRIYEQISRINHSCDPNAVIVTESDLSKQGESQKVVAAATIAKGEPITISYLGLMLYTDRNVRKKFLLQDKFFDCHCSRCSSDDQDTAGNIPCPTCHPREAQQILDEDVQYDDDQTVHYMAMDSKCGKCKQPIKDKKVKVVSNSVCKKVSSFLEQRQSKQLEGSNDDDDNDDQILEEYISVSSSVMGAKHWTTNLLLLLHVNDRLSTISRLMITNQELPEMEEVAEVIDSVERVCRFVTDLNLKLHMGHLLSDVIIGIARTLVSLGDAKSQKYGAEWLERLDGGYVHHFESDGKQKVVHTLMEAWKQDDDDDGPERKKAKSG